MNIGLIARCDSTGLGIQSKEFFDHIPCKALVIDFSQMSPPIFRDIMAPHPEWYPGQTVYKWGRKHNMRGDINPGVIYEFLEGVDILFTIETPYDFNVFDICRDKKIKTVLQFNYEFLDYPSRWPMPNLLAAPSTWNFDQVPGPKKLLPVPVNTDKFTPSKAHKTFVHIAGRQAVKDRNGTDLFLRSLRYVKNDIRVYIRSQHHIRAREIPSNVELIWDIGNKENYQDNYGGGVLVMPRKYGGLCLPHQEAIASGMPVITTDISPNNDWLPKEWLVRADHIESFQSKRRVDVYEADMVELARKIDDFCEVKFYDVAYEKTLEIREKISWRSMLPLYYETFEQLK